MPNTLKVLDLFSGIGGFSLGLERAGMETVAFCEIEKFCREVLEKHWPHTPIAKNIRELSYHEGKLYDSGRIIYDGTIDVICGGFPCQPFSVAGRKKGTDDYRDLWPEMFRLIQQVQPAWIIGENVANFINLAFTRTKSDLENEGYTVQSFIIPACAIGAPHRRDRVWIIAYRNSGAAQPPRCSAGAGGETPPSLQAQEQERHAQAVLHNGCAAVSGVDVPNTHKSRLEGCFRWTKRGLQPTYELFAQFWRRDENDLPKPTICRTDDGFSSRVDRLKSLGNSVVPQIPEIIGHAIIKTSKD